MAYKKNYRRGKNVSLLTSLEGRLDMTMPGATNNQHMKGKDCGCGKKKMNMGGTVPSANTYWGKK